MTVIISPGAPTHTPPTRGALPRPTPHSGWAAFDALHIVRPGRLLVLDVGSRTGQRLVMRLLSDAVAKTGEAIVVDGGNWLDVYHLGNEAAALGHDRLATLLGVRVARGFTCYQLQSLIEHALPQLMQNVGPHVGLVLVPSLPEMYLDEDLKRDEAAALLERAMRTLRDVAREHDVPVIATNITLSPTTRHKIRSVLDDHADDVVGLFPAEFGALRLTTKDGVTLASNPRMRQRLLTDYADVPVHGDDEGAFYRRAYDARIRYLPKRVGEMKSKQRREVIA